jgi:4-hydroxybenzoate polyprenyltransferase
LDLSIFSPLKAAYRKELSNLSLLTDSTPIGKRNFLLCYQKAREQSIIAQNIKAGWRATGLWPLNMAKPLMSRLLLENSNNDSQLALKGPIREGLVWDKNQSLIAWETPKAAKELRVQIETITQLDETNLSTRPAAFQKSSKMSGARMSRATGLGKGRDAGMYGHVGSLQGYGRYK